MATVRRIGFGTVFELENDVVGIGTDNPTHKLQALGNIRSEGVQDVGVTTLTTYQGFTDKEARFGQVTTDKSQQLGTLSGEIVIDGDVTVSSATTFTSGPQHLTVTDTFTLPSGDTNSRELKPTVGSFRFNQDFATLEFYTGNNWATVNTFTEIQNSPGNRGRGLIFGGYPTGGPQTNIIDYFNIQSKGNSLFFGELTSVTRMNAGLSSNTRGINAVSYPSPLNEISYVTIASEGNSIDFGNLTSGRQQLASLSSQTRGIFAGGAQTVNIIEYIEINTLGDALDFGDLTNGRRNTRGAASPTRGIVTAGGEAPNFVTGNEFLTIASKGNGVDFGAVNGTLSGIGAGSNGIRGIFAGGYNPAKIDKITHVKMASLGNVVNFGNLILARQELQVLPDKTRAVFTGGWGPAPAPANVINTTDFILFSSGGSAEDFGDLSTARAHVAGCTDSHGGLGGF